MKTTRRDFLQHVGLLGAAAAANVPPVLYGDRALAAPPETLLDTNKLARFVDPLPIPAIVKPRGMRSSPANPEAHIPFYRVSMRELQAKVHRDVKPTTFWGYDAAFPGPTFEVRKGQPILVEWANELPRQHFLPIDHTLHGAEADKPEVRTVVHLHGGRNSPESDGYPENWFVSGQSATCHYQNQQEATSLFYHDHAMGITRLNAVAGLVGMYLIRDEVEDSLHLPTGAYEIPLVIFDRSFRQDGEIHYPVSGKPEMPWVSEYYGSALLVNGKIFPYLEVEPRQYRFRLLNSSNGSFYRLSFSPDHAITSDCSEFFQIGSEQGLLEAPARMKTLILGRESALTSSWTLERWLVKNYSCGRVLLSSCSSASQHRRASMIFQYRPRCAPYPALRRALQ